MKYVTVEQMDSTLRQINEILAKLDGRLKALEEQATTRKPAAKKEEA